MGAKELQHVDLAEVSQGVVRQRAGEVVQVTNDSQHPGTQREPLCRTMATTATPCRGICVVRVEQA
jgi:hypothetical protein